MAPRARRGFTLVECAAVCAVAAVLAALALPSYRSSELRAARLDAVSALTRLQVAQEQYRSLTGLYANDFAPLRGTSALSAQGRYALSVTLTGPDAYHAQATAIGVQAQDSACAMLTLDVSLGFAHEGPSAACWNR
jgi:type IV pilus assembly protein PilE